MLEALLQINRAKTVIDPNLEYPDDQLTDLIAGTASVGYYGIATASSVISGDALAASIGLSAGTSINSSAGWLKFSKNGKRLYIARMPYRYGLSWQSIYQAGAVYGDGTTGTYPSGTATTQNKQLLLNDDVFNVRLFSGLTADPSSGGTTNAGADLSNFFWNVLAVKTGTQGTGAWATLDIAATGGVSGANGTSNWLKETYSGNHAYRLCMTGVNASPNSATNTATATGALLGWRPVLEEV